MLSEDFAYAWEKKRPWKEFYREEIVNNEMYKTLFFSYKGRQYEFQPAGSDVGKVIDGKKILPESYIFFEVFGEKPNWTIGDKIEYYSSFKDAVDHAKMEGKTLAEIWDDPESSYLDFE